MAAESLSACIAEIKANPKKFYVYVLCKPDEAPFYVGVGRGQSRGLQRIEHHEREATKPETLKCNKHKRNVIRHIWSGGGAVLYKIDSWHFWDFEAREREIELIKQIGRADLDRGPLTNWTDGGNGLNTPSTSHRKKMSDRMSGLHTDPVFAAARDAKIVRVNADPVLRAKTKAAVVAANALPKNRKRILENIKRINTSEMIAESTRRIRLLNSDPGFVDKSRARSRAVLLRNMELPEFWRLHAEGNAKRRGDPEWKKKCSEAQLRLHADPIKSETMKRKLAAAMRAQWADPEYRNRIMASRRASRARKIASL